MLEPTRSLGTSTVLLILAAALPLQAEFRLEPCKVPGLEEEVLCGTYEVFEDRAARAGRKIPLNVVLLPATGASPDPDPVVLFAGGPGVATTESAAGVASFMAKDREQRDLLLVDYRGTGKSNPLFCPYQETLAMGAAEALETFIPVDELDECRETLEKVANLALYTTPNIVDDVAEVSRALGYDRVNLSGGSYGTRAALVFMARHPEMARTAVLEGAVPTWARMPVTFAADSQAALDGWFHECARDEECSAAFPDPAADLATVLRELDAGPRTIEVTDPKTRETVELRLSRAAFVQTLRYMLYSSMGALQVPAYLHAAAGGDWAPLAQTAFTVAGGLMASVPDGLYLSVTCTEDVARIGPNAAATQVGFLGDFRLRAQVEACAEWPRGELPDDFYEPVRSDAAVLIVSGERDPVTPARWGYEVQEFLTNSAHLVVPDGGHGWFGLEGQECLTELASELLASGSVADLDLDGCVGSIERPSFLLAIPKDEEIEMSSAALERFAGSYTLEGGGFQVTFEVTEEGLMGAFGEDDVARMAPLGGTRFRAEGEPPGNYYDFVEESGEIRRLELVRGETTLMVFVKD